MKSPLVVHLETDFLKMCPRIHGEPRRGNANVQHTRGLGTVIPRRLSEERPCVETLEKWNWWTFTRRDFTIIYNIIVESTVGSRLVHDETLRVMTSANSCTRRRITYILWFRVLSVSTQVRDLSCAGAIAHAYTGICNARVYRAHVSSRFRVPFRVCVNKNRFIYTDFANNGFRTAASFPMKPWKFIYVFARRSHAITCSLRAIGK